MKKAAQNPALTRALNVLAAAEAAMAAATTTAAMVSAMNRVSKARANVRNLENGL